ncbi:hypothetical protein ACMAZF_05655 [Psychrobium sp. nBUS_13]|uniref:hypothetical protein n=1 Tax=Psychrobium sp. nBUS_13 TaxID=3395319 RepID=UPI003EBD4564
MDGRRYYDHSFEKGSIAEPLGSSLSRSPAKEPTEIIEQSDDDINDDVLFSRKATAAEEAIGQGAKSKGKSTVERIVDDFKSGNWRKTAKAAYDSVSEGVFDGLAGVKRAEKDILGDAWSVDKSGYVSARLATGVADVMTAVTNYGAPKWKDGVIQEKTDKVVWKDEGGKSHSEDSQGLVETFKQLGDDLNGWLGWMAAHRAENLMEQGLENNLTLDDIKELKAKAKGKEAKFLRAKEIKGTGAFLLIIDGNTAVLPAMKLIYEIMLTITVEVGVKASANPQY